MVARKEKELNMKRLFPLILCGMMALGLAACTGEPEQDAVGTTTTTTTAAAPATHTVSYYDGDTLLKTAEVADGATAEDFTPEKDGYLFTGWYGTPSFNHAYDFSRSVDSDTSIYAQFAQDVFVEDMRSFYIVGSGAGEALATSIWGAVIEDIHALEKSSTPGVNEYTITLNLYEGDQFQFAVNSAWENQRGAGYLTESDRDGEAYFATVAGTYDPNVAKSNIKVVKDGNYTLTLTTHPWDDEYDTANEYYSEETRENYNHNQFDTITWVYNGPSTGENFEAASVHEIIIKGSMTEWENDAQTKTVDGVAEIVYTLTEGDEFGFSRYPEGTVVGDGEYMNIAFMGTSGDANANISGAYNFTCDVSGEYRIVVDMTGDEPVIDFYTN